VLTLVIRAKLLPLNMPFARVYAIQMLGEKTGVITKGHQNLDLDATLKRNRLSEESLKDVLKPKHFLGQ
jgi:hypothetical protein